MAHAQDSQEPHKRKRDADDSGSQPAHSDRIPQPPPPQSGNSSIINYLSKASAGKLRLIQGEPDTFSDVLGLLNQYEGVLSRHESLAANLGAKLTGPRLLKAMEGAFEGPIITNPPTAYGAAPVSWIDIVSFAKTNPEKFVLTTGHDGERTCQFYLGGVQVQILEDDWRLIMNGALDRFSIVSTAPLEEDETAEVATLEIVEQRLQVLIKKADEIAKRARQLNYHLSGRKAGINSRHGGQQPGASGFPSVNHPQRHVGGHGSGYDLHADLLQQFLSSSSQGYPPRAPSNAGLEIHSGQHTPPATNPHPHSLPLQGRPVVATTHAPVIPQRDSSYDPSSAHRGIITARIEKLSKGDQIWPPCDRCRRLKSPCVKHLTACQGCTKKHAKCGWKTITEEEIAWLNRDASSSADEAQMEPNPTNPIPRGTLRYDPTQDDGRSNDEPPPSASLMPGEISRPASRGQQSHQSHQSHQSQPGHRQRSPMEPGSRSRTSSFMDVEHEPPPNPKPWMPEPNRGDQLPPLKRGHMLLSHMASAATAAADARDASITPAGNMAGR